MNQSVAKLFPAEPVSILSFCGVLTAAIIFAFAIGPAFVWPDALGYADEARGLMGQGGLGLAGHTLPLYAMLLMPLMKAGNIAGSYQALVVVQTAFIASAFFPMRAILVHGGMGPRPAAALAAAGVLAPVYLTYAPLVTPESLFIVALLYFVYFYERLLAGEPRFIGTGISLALLMLTLPAGWVVFLASLVIYFAYSRHNRNRSAYLIWLIAFFIYCGWQVSTQHGFGLHLFANEPLARFNFIKNGLLYIVYAGAPLTGLTLLLAAILKRDEFWRKPFAAFCLVSVLGVLLLDAFSVSVYVDKKLDYVSNRMLDPFMLLPMLAFFRLSPETQREFLINGLLIFLVFAFFELPHGLKLDFHGGLGFWAQSLSNAQYAVVHNVIYLVLICVPAAFVAFRASWLAYGYAVATAVIFCFGLAYNLGWWKNQTDANLAYIEAASLPQQTALQNIKLYTDYQCAPETNRDPAYLYRCIDAAKLLYFMPAELSPVHNVPTGAGFVATESDSRSGSVLGEAGLAKIVETTPAKLPYVEIRRIEGLTSYIKMGVAGKIERFTMLPSGSVMRLISSSKGCVNMKLRAGMDRPETQITLQLDSDAKKFVQLPRLKDGMPKEQTIRLNVPAGASALTIEYDPSPKEKGGPSVSHLVMFDRPWFGPCQ